MPITESGKDWQKRNRGKAAQYVAKYAQSRTKVSFYLEDWITKEIAQVKAPEQTYGNWIRLHIEEWARTRQSTDVAPENK
ncbi:hypothetical protein [Scytonema sp. PCC 10023]|uniref:hypothetical protein n=1 Tax=Scytonema sp. PCC 10023 TaxID=1680591 RepID=UPI0039C5C749